MDEELSARFDQVLRQMAETRHEIADTRQALALEIINTRESLEGRIGGVEGKLGSFRDETLAHFDEIYRRLDVLESEYYSISAALSG